MRKKLGTIILSVLLIVGLVGCGSSGTNGALKQGKESLQKKEYSKALASFDIVLDNDTENKEAAVLKKITNDYIAAKKYLEQWEIDKAQNRIEMIDSQYTEYPIKDAVDNLIKQVDEALEANKVIFGDINKLTVLYNDKKYDEAKKIISELNKKRLNSRQKEEINNINNKINEELKKIEEKREEEKKAEELKKIEDKKRAENAAQFYTTKLNDIEIGIKEDLKKAYEGTTASMNWAALEEVKRWDKAVNEIYDYLKTQLSPSDISKLEEEQIQWLADSEKAAENVEYTGSSTGVMSRLLLVKSKKARCYELIEKYLKANNMQEDVKENTKEIYINKLNDIEEGIKKDLSKLYEGNMAEMREAANEEYKRWDKILNEIYGVLKTQLSDSDMSNLQEEQIQWISDKEKKAKAESLEFKGGTLESLTYVNSLSVTTKVRCYELVEKYMK